MFRPIAGAEEDENSRRGGLLGDFIDPLRELRQERYEELRAQLRNLEPGNPALETLTGPDYAPTWADIDELDAALRDAQGRLRELQDPRWQQLGWSARGIAFETERIVGERSLPPNTPIIDDFRLSIAISIKSIDLNAPTYRDPVALSRRIDRYVDHLSRYNGTNWGNARIPESAVKRRLLDIVVPKNSSTTAQWQAIRASIERAHKLDIIIFVGPY